MPFIEEDTLLDLYKEIDVSNKDKEQYRKSYFEHKESNKKIKNLYAWGMGGLTLILMGALAYIFIDSYQSKSAINPNQQALIIALQDSLAAVGNEVNIINERSLAGVAALDNSKQVVYKVQLASYKKPSRVELKPWQLGENGYMRLAVGEFPTYKQATALKTELKRIGFANDIFLIAVYQDEVISLKQAVKMSEESYLLNDTK
ncbi:hypothetical protein ABN763_02250 [Spongiivirga sp. MCCC 1A20706]|uniref:hypothetical protein n=1 Tax=Spongiivirga sp. MCCC 1A20706 TaxID=3160963 RepID=UPI0039775A2C